MESRNTVLALFLFLIIGAAFVGVETVTPEPQYQKISQDCQNYTQDSDNDGADGFITDESCWDYPYEDGLGEAGTHPSLRAQNPPYQSYYDLTVDFVRLFVTNECGGNLANCIGTNFQYESQFYCWFSSNIMNENFYDIFDKFYFVSQVLPDDGSRSQFVSICGQLSPPSGDLPMINYQQSSPIPENTAGSAEGGGEKP